MTIIEAYLDIKAEFERLDREARARAFALKDLARRLEAPVNQPVTGEPLDNAEHPEAAELLARRLDAWTRAWDAWEALPADRQVQLSAPAARRPVAM